VSYVRATAAVALVDAVGIGIGLAIVGVPLVIPLSALVFLSAFVPIIGAVLAGTVAVLITLVANGFVSALIVLAIVVGVMQLESHVLQPWLLGRAVRLHPLAVVLAIAAGLIAAGIAGALLSVPLLAILNAGIKSLLHDEETEPEEIDVLHQEEQAPPDEEAPEDTKATWER
jgi:predicted PurR-regulated permease PerM